MRINFELISFELVHWVAKRRSLLSHCICCFRRQISNGVTFSMLLQNLTARRATRLEWDRKKWQPEVEVLLGIAKFVACHCHFCFARRRRLLLPLMHQWWRIRAFYSWSEPRIRSQRCKIEQPTRTIATTTKLLWDQSFSAIENARLLSDFRVASHENPRRIP